MYTGAIGAPSTVTGPTGASYTGPTVAASIVIGYTGGASTVTGPVGVSGVSYTGPTGAASTVNGPTGTVRSTTLVVSSVTCSNMHIESWL